jgi:two-component system, cell cycle response regulator DivK
VTKILVVEDEPDNARMISRMLRMRGFEVVLAVDGDTAASMAKSQRPDLIVMDLLLAGGIDGSEATRQIKSAPETQGVPVIMLSASHLASFQNEAFEAGADDVDTKPVDFDRLTGKIAALLTTAAARS